MEDLVGYFVLAKVEYAERDGRYKLRPCLIIAQKMLGDRPVYLAVPKYSAWEKCKGGNEVVMAIEDAVAVGMDKEGVLRFNREHLEPMFREKIFEVFVHYTALPELKQQSLQNAARRDGYHI